MKQAQVRLGEKPPSMLRGDGKAVPPKMLRVDPPESTLPNRTNTRLATRATGLLAAMLMTFSPLHVNASFPQPAAIFFDGAANEAGSSCATDISVHWSAVDGAGAYRVLIYPVGPYNGTNCLNGPNTLIDPPEAGPILSGSQTSATLTGLNRTASGFLPGIYAIKVIAGATTGDVWNGTSFTEAVAAAPVLLYTNSSSILLPSQMKIAATPDDGSGVGSLKISWGAQSAGETYLVWVSKAVCGLHAWTYAYGLNTGTNETVNGLPAGEYSVIVFKGNGLESEYAALYPVPLQLLVPPTFLQAIQH